MGLLPGRDKNAVPTIDAQLRQAVFRLHKLSKSSEAEQAAVLRHIDELLDQRRTAYEQTVIRECERLIATG